MKTSKELLLMAVAAAFALPCHAGLPPAVYNLGSLGGTGATISGPGLAAHAGTALAGNCDLNGDGIVDLVIGAPPAGATFGGAVYVIYGSASGAPPPFSVNDADVAILGESDGDSVGSSLACADVNGDGIDDLVIGAPGVTPAGYAYVVYVVTKIVTGTGGLPEIETRESLHRQTDANCCPSAYRVTRHRWDGTRIAPIPGSVRIVEA